MKYLLDTHLFIWAMEDNRRVPGKIKLLLKDPINEILISLVSVWEMVIKKSKGKLKVPKDIAGGVKEAGFKILPIEISHVLGVERLTTYKDHKDPFDRLLIAQAKVENLTLITSDPKIWQYKINLIKV